MKEQIAAIDGLVPRHWIGVVKRWELSGVAPLDQLVTLPPRLLKTHALVIGSTGSGKTNLLHHLIAQDLLAGHSFCVFDQRGDLIAAVIEMCVGRVDPDLLRLIDLREKRRQFGFNPLYGSGEPYFRALNVLDVIASESESWGVQLSETLRNCLMLLSESQEPLTKLEDLFFDESFLLKCLHACKSKSVLRFWQRYDALSADKKASLVAPVLNKTSLLLSTDTVQRILGHRRPIDFFSHLNKRGSVTLISLAIDQMHSAGQMMGRMILSSISREIFARVQIPEHQRNPVRLYVDEFEHFGMQEFENLLAEGRRFGCSLVLAHQTLAQLSSKMRSMILGNVGTKVVFRSGREDGATLSKDLTGDPNRYGLSELSVGTAVLWNRELGTCEIEVNEPLFKSVGIQSKETGPYLDLVYARALCPEKVSEVESDIQATLADPSVGSLKSQATTRGLEDWLCA